MSAAVAAQKSFPDLAPEILRVRQLLADGFDLSEIAREMGLSEAEVRRLMDLGKVVP